MFTGQSQQKQGTCSHSPRCEIDRFAWLYKHLGQTLKPTLNPRIDKVFEFLHVGKTVRSGHDLSKARMAFVRPCDKNVLDRSECWRDVIFRFVGSTIVHFWKLFGVGDKQHGGRDSNDGAWLCQNVRFLRKSMEALTMFLVELLHGFDLSAIVKLLSYP